MSSEERACWFRKLTDTALPVSVSRSSGRIRYCAAGSMKEYGEWQPATAAVPFLKQYPSAFTIAISRFSYYAHSIMHVHIIIMTDSCVQNAFKRHSNGFSCES